MRFVMYHGQTSVYDNILLIIHARILRIDPPDKNKKQVESANGIRDLENHRTAGSMRGKLTSAQARAHLEAFYTTAARAG